MTKGPRFQIWGFISTGVRIVHALYSVRLPNGDSLAGIEVIGSQLNLGLVIYPAGISPMMPYRKLTLPSPPAPPNLLALIEPYVGRTEVGVAFTPESRVSLDRESSRVPTEFEIYMVNVDFLA